MTILNGEVICTATSPPNNESEPVIQRQRDCLKALQRDFSQLRSQRTNRRKCYTFLLPSAKLAFVKITLFSNKF